MNYNSDEKTDRNSQPCELSVFTSAALHLQFPSYIHIHPRCRTPDAAKCNWDANRGQRRRRALFRLRRLNTRAAAALGIAEFCNSRRSVAHVNHVCVCAVGAVEPWLRGLFVRVRCICEARGGSQGLNQHTAGPTRPLRGAAEKLSHPAAAAKRELQKM